MKTAAFPATVATLETQLPGRTPQHERFFSLYWARRAATAALEKGATRAVLRDASGNLIAELT